MTIYDYLQALERAQMLDEMVRLGILNVAMYRRYCRYGYYLSLRSASPLTRNFHSVLDTAIHFGCSEQVIYHDIRAMQQLWTHSTSLPKPMAITDQQEIIDASVP